ncbi:hypothetical protein ALP60_02503 [Pseudomonas savastanoi]|uniref:Uncharacterized protein n=1 Tax=Pseudomonas savastanoi TaxID=29438 RepID=A0A3M5FRS4_PSESS|nr:hypothetical protein ALP60_02503 [Pseudomonas savastanoi]
MSNFFGHRLISQDIAPGSSKRWVALLDQKLATTHDQVPGIAEMQGVVSVHVQDIPAGRPTRISEGTDGPHQNTPTRCDFTIAFADPALPGIPLPPATPVDDMLIRELRGSVAEGEHWAGQYGFVHGENTTWLRVPPEEWTADSPMTAIQQSLADATYEMPLDTRTTLHTLANFERKGLDMEYFFEDTKLDTVRNTFAQRRKNLQKDAATIRSAQLPPRPTLPAIEPQTSTAGLLETLYRHTEGIVIGESHFSVSSKKLIIDNLPLLARQNVKTLYMEHLLTDLHQADLDRFFETGQMSKTLLHDLKILDRGHHTDPDKVYNFEQLIIKARQYGLEVRAIDCASSYQPQRHCQGRVHHPPADDELLCVAHNPQASGRDGFPQMDRAGWQQPFQYLPGRCTRYCRTARRDRSAGYRCGTREIDRRSTGSGRACYGRHNQ